ncbi:DNA/RNA non-specific endonuclease [Asanoa sp. WMMD1127]|uniref:DNA/RNA non-specific endonuclease n=1 Tax=Asanoa sp. WMMD1127 TaxID=3016107 RepID=UPI00241652B2|nr:DNA/RNA non-specific endonuclease [Asanoa sp. WMMD1127]MDG4827408.1 DNA/RNA non-specific endonuclease [Asanoa sp. WMMD1127]
MDDHLRVDPHYAGRSGFDPDFLGRRLALPTLDVADAATGPAAPDGVLRYHHFSVVMHARRRLAILSAANLDGRRRFTHVTSGDRWIVDPRLPAAQTGEDLYAGNDLDRGHLTRRADQLWGDTRDEAAAAVADTYHFSNCAPQHRDFNQNNATWQGLEDYILTTVADQRLRANVYTGPILDPDDPIYRGVRLPRAYWKVVAVATDGAAVHATAYLIEQTDLLSDLDRSPPLGPYRTFQTSVRHVAARTGLGFGPLPDYDPTAPVQRGAERYEIFDLHDVKL